ncbi:MAG: cupin domain-containing protein [Mycobacterium sp.]
MGIIVLSQACAACDTLKVMKALQLWTAIPLAVVAVALAAPAAATPGIGVDAQTLSTNTVDGTEYMVSRITLAPGGETGWHFHPGEVFGVVRAGTMTHYDGDCIIDEVYNTGSAVAEGIGSAQMHNGRNEGSTPLVMEVTYINPVGAPLSVDGPVPTGCPVS